MLPTFRSWTADKIIEYLTLGLLSSFWNVYHSTTTAYFFDPPCTYLRFEVKTSFKLKQGLLVSLSVIFYRAMLCIRNTSHGHVFVCLSVCLSQVGVLLKRLCRWGGSKSATFDKQPAISRKRYKIDAWFLLKSNRKSYALYRMVALPMTSSAP